MFKTKIDGNEIGVVFQHQRAAHIGQLTRPEVWISKGWKLDTKRVAVYAVTYCFFNETCVGVAYCAYADRPRYSREVGRRLALKNALATVLKRAGKKDHIVREERAQVWEDYFRSGSMRNQVNPLVLERAIGRMARELKAATLCDDLPLEPMIPWKLSQPMPNEVIEHLNEEEKR